MKLADTQDRERRDGERENEGKKEREREIEKRTEEKKREAKRREIILKNRYHHSYSTYTNTDGTEYLSVSVSSAISKSWNAHLTGKAAVTRMLTKKYHDEAGSRAIKKYLFPYVKKGKKSTRTN